MFKISVRSRHPSHNVLRTELPRMPFRSVVRLGSRHVYGDEVELNGNRVSCNIPEAINNSANKLRMKECFENGDVPTADWSDDIYWAESELCEDHLIVAKHIFGSRGRGNTLIKSERDLEAWRVGKTLDNYIFERYYPYSREYRLHVDANGCFYSCRKMLRDETPERDRWFRNDSNSIWVMEDNPAFDRPSNWDEIESACVDALDSTGLDVGACDVKVQSASRRGNLRAVPKFIVIEINSAPSFGTVTAQKYLERIPTILLRKAEVFNNV